MVGRKIKPVFYNFSTARALQNPSAHWQKMCTFFTEDNQVVAVIVGNVSDALMRCLAERETIGIPHVPVLMIPRSTFSRFAPYLYTPVGADLERFVSLWMRRAKAVDYFRDWNADPTKPGAQPAKVGVLYMKSSWNRGVFAQVVEREVRKNSENVAATFGLSADVSRWGNEVNAAVLRFKQSGVTHVIAQGTTHIVFAPAAESQKYRPRYLVSTSSNPRALPDFVSPEQLNGALGLGYMPTSDVDQKRDPGNVSSAQAKCRKAMEAAGLDTSNRGGFTSMLQLCDVTNFLASAIENGGLSPAGVRAGAESMGTMAAASIFRMMFSRGVPSGVAVARDLAYQNSCDCFAYQGQNDHSV